MQSLILRIQVTIKSAYKMLYSDEDQHLNKVEEEKEDLGVLFNSTLKFNNHIKACNNDRLLGVIKRTFLTTNFMATTLI